MENRFVLRDISVLYRGANVYYLANQLDGYKLTGSDPALLAYVSAHSPVEQDVLVKHFMMDRATITKALDRLEQVELLTRKCSHKDRRANVIVITEKGKTAAQFFRDSMSHWCEVVLDGFSAQEKAEFIRLCEKAAHNAWSYLHENDGK